VDRRSFLEHSGRVALSVGGFRAVAAGAEPGKRLLDLARSIDGDVVTAASPTYEQARLVQSTRFDRVRPLAIVYVAGGNDVAAALAWARKYGVQVAARSGGHSYGGYSTTGGIVLDTSRLSAVTVAADATTAAVGAGARLIDVYAGLWNKSVAIPAGSCASVGIAGLTLGGGVGYASRKLGLTCDNLIRVEIVTADGEQLVCDPTHHPDLFWACRGGGGGNFGVATGLTFAVHPVSNVATYSIEWPWAQAAQAIHAWQAFAPHAPDGLYAVCDLLATDPGPTARSHVVSAGQFFGSEADLQNLIQPLANAGSPLAVTTKTRGYLDAALFWAGCSGETVGQCHLSPRGTLRRSTFAAHSNYADRPLSPAAIGTLVSAIDVRQSTPTLGRGSILLDPYGGAINRTQKGATAFVHRSQLFSLQELAFWAPGASSSVVAANRKWLADLGAAIRPAVSAEAYQNYIDPDLAGWGTAYYGSNYARLRAVKRRYDPTNAFHFAQSIPLKA
jgi:FAD/FMN-containing dehydrogenase